MPINRIDISPLLPALQRNATILVPNHRIRDAIVSTYAHSLQRPVFVTPPVFAIDIWIREFWDLNAHCGVPAYANLQLLSSSQEQFLWTDVIEQSLSQNPLLNPEETAATVNASYRNLKQWLPRNNLTRLSQYSDAPDVKAFLHWIKSYQRQCEKLQVISLVDAIVKMVDESELYWTESDFIPAEICLVNFFEPPPLYEELFAQFARVASVERMSLYDDTGSPELSHYAFQDQESELKACATWARNLVATAPEQHIGIIFAADPLAQPNLRDQLRACLAPAATVIGHTTTSLFNSSGSRQSLLDTGLIHDAFLILKLVNHDQSSLDLSRLLQSPYLIAAATEQEARLQMELQLRRRGTARTSLAEFSRHLQRQERTTYAPVLAAALLQARTRLRQFPARASAREWAVHISSWLSDFGWPGAALSSQDRDKLGQWHELLHTFAASTVVLGSLTLGAAVGKLKSLCQQQALTSAFNGGIPLSIYSVPEAIGLHFDQVWLLDFSDQNWPPAAQPSPFIPHLMQQEAQIPGCSSSLQLQRAGRQFAILKSSVRQRIIGSYHRTDGELEYSPSSFINAWPVTTELPWETTFAQQAAAIGGTAILETITDLPAFPVQAQEAVHGGASIISNQSNCPFRAFATHRLHAEPLERFSAGLSMRERGIALHAALEMLFTNIASRAEILALDTIARDSLLTNAAEHGVAYLSRHNPELMTPRFRVLEQRRIWQLLHAFLLLESNRDDFHVVARETAIEWQFGKLQLRVKIDRIDALGDSSLALLDYKSGKRAVSSKSWLETRPEDMQMPLYYTITTASGKPPVSALIIAHVNAEKMRYSGLVASANVHESLHPVGSNSLTAIEWPELTGNWQKAVHLLTAEFSDGVARVAPLKGRKTCEYCGLQPLCRIQELDSSMVDDEPEVDA